jgi:hypothetical protein
MTKQLIWVAAALIAASAPAVSYAQVSVDVPGVGVRVGEPPRHDDVIVKERSGPAMEERDVRARPDCKSVTVQRDTPGGSESKTKTRCN